MTRHNVFSVPATLPEAKRRAALDLQVRKSFPYANPGFTAFWKGNDATVYAWDATAVQAAIEKAGLPRTTVIIPETFIRDRGTSDARLVAALEGFEGQIWRDGFLVNTRWWPVPPQAAEWFNFMRASGLASTSTSSRVTPCNLAILERPWTEGTFSIDDLSTLFQSQRAIGVLATAALCPFLFLGTYMAIIAAADANLKRESAALSAANQGLRKDRSESFDNLEAIEDYIRLDAYRSQANVLTTAMTLLGNGAGPRILSWSFDRGSLEIIVRDKNTLDPTSFITAFERDPLFEGVGGTLIGPERDLQLRMALSKKEMN